MHYLQNKEQNLTSVHKIGTVKKRKTTYTAKLQDQIYSSENCSFPCAVAFFSASILTSELSGPVRSYAAPL